MVLRDISNGSIELTLWGATSADPGEALFNRVQVRGVSGRGSLSWVELGRGKGRACPLRGGCQRESFVTSEPIGKEIEILCEKRHICVQPPLPSLYMHQGGDKPILAVKGARVGDFNGKTVSNIGSSTFRVDPNIPETHDLRQW